MNIRYCERCACFLENERKHIYFNDKETNIELCDSCYDDMYNGLIKRSQEVKQIVQNKIKEVLTNIIEEQG